MVNPYLVGKHVYLRHPTEEDALGKWHEWFSDEETTKYLIDQWWPNSIENQMDIYRSLVDDWNRGSRIKLVLSVVTKKDDIHIGIVGLSGINWVHRYADLIIIIGEEEYRKIPYTLEAHELMHVVSFIRLNLLNVKSYFFSWSRLPVLFFLFYYIFTHFSETQKSLVQFFCLPLMRGVKT